MDTVFQIDLIKRRLKQAIAQSAKTRSTATLFGRRQVDRDTRAPRWTPIAKAELARKESYRHVHSRPPSKSTAKGVIVRLAGFSTGASCAFSCSWGATVQRT